MTGTPEDEGGTKRQRQKARRQEKREAERAAHRAARRRRLLSVGVVVVLVLGVAGVFTYGWVTDRLEERGLIAAAEERFDAVGCTPVAEEPILPSPHLGEGELAANPPEAIYDVRPATSGPHLGAYARTGVYDKVVDERLLVHNLEHGYVNIFYDLDAPAAEVEALKAFAEEQIDSGRHEKIIVSAWKAELDGDANIAYAAWGARQLCREFDEAVALSFLDRYHYHAGDAPERELRPHLDDGLDPDAEEGDLLLAPLAEGADAPEETMDEPDAADG